MTKRLRTLVTVASLLIATAPAAIARAQPSPADKETARALVKQGDKAFDAKDYQVALQAYLAAHQLMNVPTTAIEVARTHVALGRLLEARDVALSVTRMPSTPNEPAAFVKARARASEMAADLAQRIPTLEISVRGLASGVTPQVAVDGEAVSATVLGLGRKVNPGIHVVTANADGYEEAKLEVSATEGSKVAVALEMKPRAGEVPTVPPPVVPPKAVPPPVVAKPVTPVPPTPTEESSVSALVYIGFIGGGAVLVGGIITGSVSFAEASELDVDCPGEDCDPNDYDTANALGWVANIAVPLGAVGVGLGIVGLFLGGSDAPPTKSASLTPLIGPGFIGLEGSF